MSCIGSAAAGGKESRKPEFVDVLRQAVGQIVEVVVVDSEYRGELPDQVIG